VRRGKIMGGDGILARRCRVLQRFFGEARWEMLIAGKAGKTSGSIIVPIPTPGSSQVSSDSRSQSMNADSLITR
jgi:hypothetical protein